MSEDKPAEADDEIVTITARVRVDEDGDYLIRDDVECSDEAAFNEAWSDVYGDVERAKRDTIVEIRIRKPKPLECVEVTVPDDAPEEPATASVA